MNIPEWWQSNTPYKIGDCIKIMKHIPDNKIDLTITSPIYNLNIKYGKNIDDKKPIENYYNWCSKWIKELYRITKVGGRFCLQIGCFQPSINEPSYASFTNICQKHGFIFRDFIIWNKNNISNRTAWGSWKSPSNPRILPPFEMIINFHKEKPKIQHKGISDISSEEFIKWTNGLWNIKPESAKNINHPAPYPIDIPIRCIKLNSYIEDIVFDPFLGSGTTLLACRYTNRIGLGCEINSKYENLIKNRGMVNIKNLESFIPGGFL